jgi:hypothetical protein
MIEFACDGCGKKLKVDDGKAGKRGKCPYCGDTIFIPQAEIGFADGGLDYDQPEPAEATTPAEPTAPVWGQAINAGDSGPGASNSPVDMSALRKKVIGFLAVFAAAVVFAIGHAMFSGDPKEPTDRRDSRIASRTPEKTPTKSTTPAKPVKKPVKPPIKKPIKKPVKPPIKKPVTPPVKPPIKKPVKKPVKPPVKPPVKKPVKPVVEPPIKDDPIDKIANAVVAMKLPDDTPDELKPARELELWGYKYKAMQTIHGIMKREGRPKAASHYSQLAKDNGVKFRLSVSTLDVKNIDTLDADIRAMLSAKVSSDYGTKPKPHIWKLAISDIHRYQCRAKGCEERYADRIKPYMSGATTRPATREDLENVYVLRHLALHKLSEGKKLESRKLVKVMMNVMAWTIRDRAERLSQVELGMLQGLIFLQCEVGLADETLKMLQNIDPNAFAPNASSGDQKTRLAMATGAMSRYWNEYVQGCAFTGNVELTEKAWAHCNAFDKKYRTVASSVYSRQRSTLTRPQLAALYISKKLYDKVLDVASLEGKTDPALLAQAAVALWDAGQKDLAGKWLTQATAAFRQAPGATASSATASKVLFCAHAHTGASAEQLALIMKNDCRGQISGAHLLAMLERNMSKEAVAMVEKHKLRSREPYILNDLFADLMNKGMLDEAQKLVKIRIASLAPAARGPSAFSMAPQLKVLARAHMQKRDAQSALWILNISDGKKPVVDDDTGFAIQVETAIGHLARGDWSNAQRIFAGLKRYTPKSASVMSGTNHQNAPPHYVVKELRFVSAKGTNLFHCPGRLLIGTPWFQMHIGYRLALHAPPAAADKWLENLTNAREKIAFKLGRRHGQWVKANNKPDITGLWTGYTAPPTPATQPAASQ